jgi:hypothetical protein
MTSHLVLGLWRVTMLPSGVPSARGVSWLWGWYLILVAVVFAAAILGSAYYRDRRWPR